jgi:hypothetical protein
MIISLQKRITALARSSAVLIKQLSEVSRLREQVREAQLAARKSPRYLQAPPMAPRKNNPTGNLHRNKGQGRKHQNDGGGYAHAVERSG